MPRRRGRPDLVLTISVSDDIAALEDAGLYDKALFQDVSTTDDTPINLPQSNKMTHIQAMYH